MKDSSAAHIQYINDNAGLRGGLPGDVAAEGRIKPARCRPACKCSSGRVLHTLETDPGLYPSPPVPHLTHTPTRQPHTLHTCVHIHTQSGLATPGVIPPPNPTPPLLHTNCTAPHTLYIIRVHVIYTHLVTVGW